MSKIDYFAKTISEDVREVVPFDDLSVSSLINDEKQIEPALAAINHRHFVVTPFVVKVFV